MTTVVALARDGAVFMAADSCTNVYERPIPDGAVKIARLKTGDGGEILIGMAGSGGLAGEIPAALKIEAVPGPDVDPQPWAHAVAKAITELAVEAGLTEDGKLVGNLLLGWGGRVWTLTHCMAIPHSDGVAALGSGEGPAIGALDALLTVRDETRMPPAQMLVTAVRIAIARDRYSDGPIHLELLPAPDPEPA